MDERGGVVQRMFARIRDSIGHKAGGETDRQTDRQTTFTLLQKQTKKIQSCCPFLGIKKQLLLKKKLQKNIEVIFFMPNVKLYPPDMRLFIMKINIFIPGARS